MILIGIDFSINKPGVCIWNNGVVTFGTPIKNTVIKESFTELLREYDVAVNIIEKYKTQKINILDEQGYTKESLDSAIGLLNTIKYMIGRPFNKEEVIISIEGFSFGSTGNRLAQLSGYQYVARIFLQEISLVENLYVYAPQSVKSVAGAAKRGAGKIGMIDRFIDHTNKLPGLDNNKFYNEMITNKETFQTKPTKRSLGGKFISPVDDLIDAYWIIQTYLNKNEIDINTI